MLLKATSITQVLWKLLGTLDSMKLIHVGLSGFTYTDFYFMRLLVCRNTFCVAPLFLH